MSEKNIKAMPSASCGYQNHDTPEKPKREFQCTLMACVPRESLKTTSEVRSLQ